MTRPVLRYLLGAAAPLFLLLGGCRGEETGGGGSTPTGQGGGGGGAAPFHVLTWNVHNLVDDHNDGAPEESVLSTAAWDAHRRDVGRFLAEVDADVVVLQEVEHEGVLSALNAQELGSRYGEVVVLPGNDPRGIDVGVLSRIPIAQAITHAADQFTRVGSPAPVYTYSRDCLELHLVHSQRPIVLLGVHYKAKEDDNPDKRLAEAQRTRAIADAITAAAPETGVLILGDFNDTPGSPPVDWTIGLLQNAPERYADAAEQVAAADRWTYVYQGERELVDHMMANPVLAPMVDPTSVRIWHTPESLVSDHAPVEATYLVE